MDFKSGCRRQIILVRIPPTREIDINGGVIDEIFEGIIIIRR